MKLYEKENENLKKYGPAYLCGVALGLFIATAIAGDPMLAILGVVFQITGLALQNKFGR